MRAVFAAVLSVLAIAGGASMPAEAAPFGDLRTAGTHKAVPLVRLARVTFDDEFRPSRRGRVDARHWKRPGYAKQRYTKQRHVKQRYAKHGKRWTRLSRHPRKGRRAVTARPSRAGSACTKRSAAASTGVLR